MTDSIKLKKILGLIAALLLTAATFWLVIRNIDGQAMWSILHKQAIGPMIVAALAVVVQIAAGCERWRSVLNGLLTRQAVGISTFKLHVIFYVSVFFNCLPLGNIGGDVARVMLMRRTAIPFSLKALSVLIDHCLAIFGPVIIGALALLSIHHPVAQLAWLGSIAILIAAGVGIYLLKFIENIIEPWAHLKPARILLRVAQELYKLACRREVYISLFYAVLSSAASAFTAYCIALSLNIDIGFVAMAAVMSMVTLITVLPISLAGWGLREVTTVTLLGMLGIQDEPALLLSIEFGLLAMLVSLPGGVMWLFIERGATPDAEATA